MKKFVLVIGIALILGLGVFIGIGITNYWNSEKKEENKVENKEEISNNNLTSESKIEEKDIKEKSVFDGKDELEYTSNLEDDINGKTVIIKKGEVFFKTEKHDGYYTYIDGWEQEYNIKEIKKIESEYEMLSNDKDMALYRCTLTYIDNNNKSNELVLAVLLSDGYAKDHDRVEDIAGPYDKFTGTTGFVRSFFDFNGNY